MQKTAEAILLAALRLFAANGYEATSVSQIASAVGLSKGALYRHYRSKQDLLDHILRRMEAQDAERARAFSLPEEGPEQMPEVYAQSGLDALAAFTRSQFAYWTEDEFACAFRRMLTLEQYRSAGMEALYQQYLGAGPLGYVRDLFAAQGVPEPDRAALSWYGPMFLSMNIYDAAPDKAAVRERLEAQLSALMRQLKEECP